MMMNVQDEFLTQFPSSTRRVYAGVLQEFERTIGPVEYASISNVIEYQKMIEDQSPATRHRKIATLASFYNFMQAMQLRPDNPTKPLRKIRVDRQRSMEWYTAREVHSLLRTASSDPRALALVWALVHGLRKTEAMQLDVSQYIEGSFRHIVGKGGKSRSVPLSKAAQRAIERYIGTRTRGPLFRSRQGRLSPSTIERIIGSYSEEAGHKISPHALRHTFANEALSKRVPLLVLQKLMGHASPVTTQIYVHISEIDTREAVDTIFDESYNNFLTVIEGSKLDEHPKALGGE